MTTATGIISWQAQASAFGDSKIDMQIASTRLASENNHRFPGQYYDAETGLHQNYFRDYEASIGRYVQRDPIGLDGGINVFGYVGGRPVVWRDSEGLHHTNVDKVWGSEVHFGDGAGVAYVICHDECGKPKKMKFVKECYGFALGLSVSAGAVTGLEGENCTPETYEGVFYEFGFASGGFGAFFDISNDGKVIEGGWSAGAGYFLQVSKCNYTYVGSF